MYCFICGNKLEKSSGENDYVQCESIKCGEVYFITNPYPGIRMHHISTPFSKEFYAKEPLIQHLIR